jgi:ribonuclease J
VRQRRKLSFVGVVVVSLVLSRRGELLAEPDVDLDGIPTRTAGGKDMTDIVLAAVDGTLESIPPQRRRDADLVHDAVRRAVRAAIDEQWGKKPIAKIMVSVVDGKA